MRIFLLSIVVLLLISAILASPGVTPKTKSCERDCPDLKPVCAGPKGTSIDNRVTKSFGSECVVNKYNCEKGEDFVVLGEGECPGGKGIRLQ